MSYVAIPTLECDGLDPATRRRCDSVFRGVGSESARAARHAASLKGWGFMRDGSGRYVDLCATCTEFPHRHPQVAARAIRQQDRMRPPDRDRFTVSMRQMMDATGFSELALAHMFSDKVVHAYLERRQGVPFKIESVRFRPEDRDRIARERGRQDIAQYGTRYPVRVSNVDRPQALGIFLNRMGY